MTSLQRAKRDGVVYRAERSSNDNHDRSTLIRLPQELKGQVLEAYAQAEELNTQKCYQDV